MKALTYTLLMFILIFLIISSYNKYECAIIYKSHLSFFLKQAENENFPYKQRNEYNSKALNILLKQKNDSLNRKNILQIANNYYVFNDWEKLKYTIDILFDKSRPKNDFINMAKVYRYYGLIYENKSMNDSAFYYYCKAQKIFQKKKDFKQICILEQDKALIQYYTNNFYDSERSLIKALKIAIRLNLQNEIYKIYINLGLNAREQKSYENALKYFEKAMKILNDKKIKFHDFHFEYCINNIGNIYLLKKEYKIAKKFFLRGLENKKLNQDPIIYSRLLDNYGKSQIQLKNFASIKDLFVSTYNYRDENNISEGQNFNRLYLSEYYTAVKDTPKAKIYAKEAYQLSKNFRAPNDMLLCLKQLSTVDPENTLQYSSEYIKISDSMHQLERETRNKFAKIAYETEEITQEKEHAEKQKSIFLGIAITVTAFGLLLLVIITQRNRQKELLYTHNQQRAKEEIYQLIQTQQSKIDEGRQIEKKRIARDLHDGIMNKLASTRFNLHVLNNKTDEETIKKCIPFIDGIHDIEKEIRNIAHDLNAEVFSETDGFKRILMTFFEEQKDVLKAKLHTDIDKSIRWELLESSTKINLYRILQEALQNISKHANADHIFLSMTAQKDYLVLEVHDDGLGFNSSPHDSGIGLQNIRARAKECKGIFHVDSHKGNGTTIIVSIPFKNQSRT